MFDKYLKQYKPHCSGFFSIAANLVSMVLLLLAPFLDIWGLALLLLVLYFEKNSGLVKQSALFGLLLWCVQSLFLFLVQAISVAFGLAIGSIASLFSVGVGVTGLFSLLFALPSLAVLAVAIYSAIQAYRWKIWQWKKLAHLPLLRWVPAAKYNGEGDVPEDCELKYKA